MTNTKITKTDRLNQIKELVADNADLVAFVDSEIAAIAAKAEKAKARAAAKKADDPLYNAVVNAVTDTPATMLDLVALIPGEDVTAAKLRTRLAKAVDAGLVKKSSVTVDGKKKTAYSRA